MSPSPPSASRAFRRGLALALPAWVDEGLVSPEAAATIQARYGLEDAAGSMQRLLVLSIYMVGAALVGGGAISFVAANWAAIPQAGQAGLLIGAMLACHLAGFHIGYQRQTHPGLGHALIVIGTLIFGASIPLFGQIFELEGHWTAAFGVWALGAGAMALAVRSVPLALAAIVVAVAGHAGLAPTGSGDPRWWVAPVLAAGGLAFGLGYGSRVVTFFTVAGTAIALQFHLGAAHGMAGALYAAMATGILYTSAGYLLRWPAGAQTIGVYLTLFYAFLASFGEVSNQAFRTTAYHLSPVLPGAMAIALPVAVLLLATGVWWRAFRQGRLDATPPVLLAGLFAGVNLLLCLVLAAGDADILFYAANLLLLALSAALIGAGVRMADRPTFWTGLLALGAVILGRFFEVDTSLLAKSVTFILLGLTVIGAGVMFEQRLRPQGSAS